MKLTDLDAQFYRLLENGNLLPVETLEEAQGVMFQCPKCSIGKEVGEEDGRKFVIGAHMVLCWFKNRGIPDDAFPTPGRWNPEGTGLNDLTFVGPGACSVFLQGEGCGWHGFVKNGEAE